MKINIFASANTFNVIWTAKKELNIIYLLGSI